MNPRVNDISERYSSWFRFVIVIGDLLLCNLVFWLAFRYGNSAGTSTQLQSQLLISAIWYACIINGGIILHIKKTRKVQIVMLMLRNVVLFAILATPLLAFGHFLMPLWWQWLLCLLAMFMLITGYNDYLSMKRGR